MCIMCPCVPKNKALMTHELSESVLNKIKELASDLNSQLGCMLLNPVFVECRRVAEIH